MSWSCQPAEHDVVVVAVRMKLTCRVVAEDKQKHVEQVHDPVGFLVEKKASAAHLRLE